MAVPDVVHRATRDGVRPRLARVLVSPLLIAPADATLELWEPPCLTSLLPIQSRSEITQIEDELRISISWSPPSDVGTGITGAHTPN